MKYTRLKISERFSSGERLKYIFFWGHHPSYSGTVTKSCFSQWYDCCFAVDGVEYSTAEQYMMAQKALLFSDKKIYREIMQASNPGAYKALGRKIKDFDENIWNNHKTDIVIRGNTAKFSQNPALREFLVATGNRILVEASPYDKIWGIGMAAQDPDIENPLCWNGENLLGFCLMEVRDLLLEENL